MAMKCILWISAAIVWLHQLTDQTAAISPHYDRLDRRATEIKHDDHGHHHRSHRYLDLDYDRLLRSFGVTDNTFDQNTVNSGDTPKLFGNETNQVKFDDCRTLQCDHGRVCRVSGTTGTAECICRPHCPAHRNPVCGSDGIWYASHCELHRISCRENRALHIVVDSHKSHCKHAPSTTSASSVLQHKDDDDESCTVKKYGTFKEKLLMHFYNRLTAAAGENASLDKRKLLRALLNEFDQDKNDKLDQKELATIQPHLEILSSVCRLTELLRNEDLDQDGFLNLTELFAAYGLPAATVSPVVTHFPHTAVVGNSIEIPCGIRQIHPSSITWERNHVKLNGLDGETGLHVNDHTAALYVAHVQLIHAGNYSCFDGRDSATIDGVQQQAAATSHSLRVLLVPEVEVEARQHFGSPNHNATLKCHAVGLPTPTVKWLKNEESIEQTSAKVSGAGSQLTLPYLLYKDTGVYSCVAQNEAGTSNAISSVFVVDQDSKEKPYRKLFAVFYAKGVAVYEPLHCQPKFRISGDEKIPGGTDVICGKDNHGCEWGSVVNVMDRYLYASQPLLNRVLVISLDQMMVVQAMNTDNIPVKLSYVPHLDQVWILCWTSVSDVPSKTVQVVRDASVKIVHTVIHPEPVNGRYQTVADLFIPPVQELAHKFAQAYAVCNSQKGLYKIDMRSLNFIRTVDLSSYGCRPVKVSYSSLGGLVFVDCIDIQRGTPKGQLVLDYLTDAVLRHDQSINGATFISPDSRYWVNLGTDVIRVQEITETGLVYLYDVMSSFHIADIAFHPSQRNHSYDLYATGLTNDHLLHVELGSNRLSTISGIGFGTGRKSGPWGNADARFLAQAGLFGSYLVSAAKSGVFVSNTDTHTVNCAIGDLTQPQFGVWFYRSFH